MPPSKAIRDLHAAENLLLGYKGLICTFYADPVHILNHTKHRTAFFKYFFTECVRSATKQTERYGEVLQKPQSSYKIIDGMITLSEVYTRDRLRLRRKRQREKENYASDVGKATTNL